VASKLEVLTVYLQQDDRYHYNFDHAQLEETDPGDCDNDRQPEIGNIDVLGTNLAIFGSRSWSQLFC